MRDLSIPSERLSELYGPMHRYYARQWVNWIGDGAKLNNGMVDLDFDMVKFEWKASQADNKVTRKMSHILMYVYSMWIKQHDSNISGMCAEMIHTEIITTISKFYTVKLSEKTINPIYSILGLFNRIKSHVCYKLYANVDNNKRHKYNQLRKNLEMSNESVRHDLLTDDEGIEKYVMNKLDFDWDFGDRLDDED